MANMRAFICAVLLYSLSLPALAGFVDQAAKRDCQQAARQYSGTVERAIGLNLPQYGASCLLHLDKPQQLLLSSRQGKTLFSFPLPVGLSSPECQVKGIGFYDHNADQQAEVVVLNQCKGAGGNEYYQHALFWSQQQQWQIDPALSQQISRFTDYAEVHQFLLHYTPPTTEATEEKDTADNGEQIIVIDGHFQRYANGVAFIRMDNPEIIYPVREAPAALRLDSASLPSKPVRARVRLLESWQSGVAHYQAIVVEGIQALK